MLNMLQGKVLLLLLLSLAKSNAPSDASKWTSEWSFRVYSRGVVFLEFFVIPPALRVLLQSSASPFSTAQFFRLLDVMLHACSVLGQRAIIFITTAGHEVIPDPGVRDIRICIFKKGTADGDSCWQS